MHEKPDIIMHAFLYLFCLDCNLVCLKRAARTCGARWYAHALSEPAFITTFDVLTYQWKIATKKLDFTTKCYTVLLESKLLSCQIPLHLGMLQ